VRLSPLGTAATTGLLYQPQMIDDGDCGAIGGMKIGRGNLVAGLLSWGALYDERTHLSFARVTVSSNKSVVSMYNLHFTCY
jgi:hypothetical protein